MGRDTENKKGKGMVNMGSEIMEYKECYLRRKSPLTREEKGNTKGK